MTDSDALLHECNRRAHEVARAMLKLQEVPHGRLAADGYQEMLRVRARDLEQALDRYEEAGRRAQLEATG